MRSLFSLIICIHYSKYILTIYATIDDKKKGSEEHENY